MTAARTTAVQSRGARVSLVIAGLLVASAGIRLAGETGHALAKEIESRTTPRTTLAASAPAEVAGLRAEATELQGVIEALAKREAAADAREKSLNARAEELESARKSIAAQLSELETAETALSDLLALADSAAEGDVAQLTTVYETMKPKDASHIFEEMAPEFAAGFLGRMRPEAAARIFAGLQPATAYSISVILAGRHVDLKPRAREGNLQN